MDSRRWKNSSVKRLLLCTDMDRTLIPNGLQPESPRAKALFERLVEHNELTLVYVTGRHRRLIEQAIVEYDLPQPKFAIGDVGTTIYEVSRASWTLWCDWQEYLAETWPLANVDRLKSQLHNLSGLTLQEDEKQNRFKVSYYVQLDADEVRLRSSVSLQIAKCMLDANVVWSVDQEHGIGLLDILPVKANKATAIAHLMWRQGFQSQNTLFAGDSGNDLDVFRSDIPSVVVANADPEIKRWAQNIGSDRLYVASGQLHELNGNYRSGILEGVCHFWPEVYQWLEDTALQ